jgi:DNA-binding MarR family transcriptional regulator
MVQGVDEGADTKYSKYIPFLDRNYNIVLLMGLALNTIDNALQEQVRESGLTAVEYEMLILVRELGDQAIPVELSRILLRTPPAITNLLNRMEKSGLVLRKGHPSNDRNKIVVMTEKGQKALEAAGLHDFLPDIIGILSEQKFEALWDTLEELKDKASSVIGGQTARLVRNQ